MRALGIIVPILCILAIAYRFYSAFIAAKVMALDDSRITPAHKKYDGANYYPTTRWVLFGHHFAAIAGAGPLVGPVLAAQFGYAPGLIWLVAGVCLAGAVQDYIWLWASTRRGGRSLADIARTEVSTVAGVTGAIAILFILIIAMAGLGIVVVNALAESAWATFTIFMTIPLAFFMGFYMFKWRRGHVQEATILGVAVLFLAVVFGKNVAESSIGGWFVLSKHQITVGMAVYTVAASVLPVWMLLTPRAYLSTFMKIGTIALLVVGVIIVNPRLEAPALSQFVGGGGPIIPGPLFPFVFITIACGAISGFHALVSTGTTSKMIDKESDIRPIGYGAMLIECVVGVVAIITACALHPGDYYAINTPPSVFATLGIPAVNLPELQTEVGEIVTGRPGGAVSLAVGSGIRWTYLAAARQDQLAARQRARKRRHCARLGVFHLDGQHQLDLADVRHCQSAARRRRARRGNDHHHQHGPREVRVRHVHPAVLGSHHHAVGRISERAGQLLADGDRSGPRAARHWLRGFDLHGDHDGLRGHHPGGDDPPVPQGSDRPRSGPRARRRLTHPFSDPSCSPASVLHAAQFGYRSTQESDKHPLE